MLRRNFIKSTALAGVAGMSGAYSTAMPTGRLTPKKITIQSVDSNFEREPLIDPPFWIQGDLSERILGFCGSLRK